LVRYVIYDGKGSHYLVVLRKPKVPGTDGDDVLAAFLLCKYDRIGMDDATFEMLKQQGEVAPGKLRELTEKQVSRWP
jgi:hypothetical protein